MSSERSPFDPAGLAAAGVSYQKKLFEIAQTNTQLAFDYAKDLMAVRSPDDAMRLTQEYMAKQTQNYQQQMKELMSAIQKKDG